ncbi:hypothetical protein RA265_29110, partial [Pseudomonas syringae pv. tagetis]|uniref:hypothetical protein n=1 Tax=Pseudomonas syringae group genomosp. 7 TaxID=251699 RepID=UPI00376F81CB
VCVFVLRSLGGWFFFCVGLGFGWLWLGGVWGVLGGFVWWGGCAWCGEGLMAVWWFWGSGLCWFAWCVWGCFGVGWGLSVEL